MESGRKYLVAVVLLAILAVAFGVLGTVAPPLAEEISPVQPQQGSPSESVGHFQNPPSFDSGWMDIRDKVGQDFNITHNLNATNVFIDLTGRRLNNTGAEHQRNLGGTGVIHGWSQTYGENMSDCANSVVQTLDGGYALAGYQAIEGALNDILLAKVDHEGNLEWRRLYGGSGMDSGFSVVQASDGGYALAGYTGSYGAGSTDAWLAKIDATGSLVWNRTYGGVNDDYCSAMTQTSDGGYALAGHSWSFGGGSYAAWLIKTDSTGVMQWNRTYGGAKSDYARAVIQTSEGGYVIAGETNSFGVGTPSKSNSYLIKTDSAGNMQWNKTYGGTATDYAYSVIEASTGGYMLVGSTYSFGVGAPTYPNAFLVKTDATGDLMWNKTFGGAATEYAYSIIETSDGGYAFAGGSSSYGAGQRDMWLVKTDCNGNIQWSKLSGGSNDEQALSLIEANEGGFALAGWTNSFGAGASDAWLVKTFAEMGLVYTALTNESITLFRGRTDPDWNYVHVRMWQIEEPTWMYGDINMDGAVDAKDLYIVGRNYGQTFSLLSLSGIIAVAGIRTVMKRKQSK